MRVTAGSTDSIPQLLLESVHENDLPWAYMRDMKWGGDLAVVGFKEEPGQWIPPKRASLPQMMALDANDIDQFKPLGGSGFIVPDFVATDPAHWGYEISRAGDRLVAWDGRDTAYVWSVDHPEIELESILRFEFDEAGKSVIMRRIDEP